MRNAYVVNASSTLEIASNRCREHLWIGPQDPRTRALYIKSLLTQQIKPYSERSVEGSEAAHKPHRVVSVDRFSRKDLARVSRRSQDERARQIA